MLRSIPFVVSCAFASAALAQPAKPPEATREYTVVAGDSCLSIAKRQIGTANALDELHRLNPQLGNATPHRLVPGQKLFLPAPATSAPDANLTSARGNVAVRRPQATDWDAAQRGMDLFRAWRVGARERASAEVTFRDSSQLRLRENTVIIIYGPNAPRQPVAAVRAEVEGGALETRLAAASGPPPSVLTPSAIATLGRGTALVTVDPAGTSLVANHAGDPISVRAVTAQKVPRGAPVRVQSGMGSRVEKGKLPEPARPLPAAPVLPSPALIVPTFAGAASVPVTWQAVPGAIRYRAVVLDESGQEQNAVLVPPGESALTLAEVPPGAVRILLSAIDAAGFEGPAATLDARVIAVAAIPPGATAPVAAAAGKVPVGAALGAPGGLTCTLTPVGADGAALGPADPVARRPGPHLARCGEAAGSATTTVDVVEIRASLATPVIVPRTGTAQLAVRLGGDVAVGPGVTAVPSPGLVIDSQAWIGDTLAVVVRASPSASARETLRLITADLELAAVEVEVAAAPIAERPSPRASGRWAIDLGGAAGLLLPADGSALGAPRAQRDRLSSGALLAATLSARSRAYPAVAARLELGASSLSSVGSSDAATMLLPAVGVGLRPLYAGPFELWALGGVGAAALLSAPATLETTTALSLHGGGAVAVRRAGLLFELSAQLHWLEPTGVSEVWPLFRVGIASTLGR